MSEYAGDEPEQPDDSDYCAACYKYLVESGISDPCYQGGPDEPSDECAWYSWYTGDESDEDGEHSIIPEYGVKQKWPWQAPNLGCLACAWLVYGPKASSWANNHACAANIGPTGASLDCWAHDQWVAAEDNESPFTDEVYAFSPFENVEGRSKTAIKQKPASHETKMGVRLGLHLALDLGTRCADYYVLERLNSDLFEREYAMRRDASGDILRDANGNPRMGYMLTDTPKEHGSDLRSEMLAYSASRWKESTNAFMARQLAAYLMMACGGELRHAPSRLLLSVGAKAVSPVLCAHDHELACCTCGVPANHMTQAHLRDCCKHKCTKRCIVRFSKRMHAYWTYTLGTDGHRHSGWQEWHRLSRRNPIIWMNECARVFNDLPWKSGYGGKPWGTAANLVVDYLTKRITPELFIDRCWTLQHHGGCFFNKFWEIEPLRHTTGGRAVSIDGETTMSRLEYVLNLQAYGDYDLLSDFCTPDVGRMWRQHSERQKRSAAQTSYIDRLLARMGGD